MKKPKRIIALLGLTALTLVGCEKDLIPSKNSDIVTVTIGEKEVPVPVDNLFDEYLYTADGLLSYYNAVYEVVVRELFEQNQTEKRKELYDRAELKVKDVKEDAKNNATGGKKYKDELESILKSHNVEDIDELREKFVYELMETELKDQFYDGGEGTWVYDETKEKTNWDELMVGDNDYVGYLERRLPYHVRHILVKVGAEANDFVTSKISRDDAVKLSGVIEALANRDEDDRFGLLAEKFSDDEGSAKEFGDLGIMSTKTPFVNEFKLGVYVYDKLYNQDAGRESDEITMPAEVEDYFTNELGLGEIPYGAHLELYKYRNREKDKDGNEVNDGNAAYYPRNIVFNKYFNNHNVSVIVPHDIDKTSATGIGALNNEFAALRGFREVPELGGKKVLTDENGNVILVVRAGASGSYEGIHFITIERSAIVDVVDGVSLEEYYTVETPGARKFPKDEHGNDKNTFVNFLRGDASLYKSRAEKIKSDVKTFDPNIKDRIFEKLVELLDVKFSDEDLKAALDVYLENQRARETYREDKEDSKLWNEWVEYLELQQYTRETRLVSEEYIDVFIAGGPDSDYKHTDYYPGA